MIFELLTNILQSASNNKVTALVIIAIICMLLYVNRNRLMKANILRKAYAEEFNDFDISAYKNYIKEGTYNVEQEEVDNDYVPTKTSELVTNCNAKIEECITY